MRFPFERNFDFAPYDTIFSSWRSRAPDFHMLAELPPLMNVPRIQVFCDESQLTLLVDKRSNGVMLTTEEIQLGDGCYSNRERPNQFVFTYGIDECGTTHVLQNGLMMFTNTLHLNLKKPLPNWWHTPSTVHISCIPKRSYDNPGFFDSMAPSENSKSFDIKAMNSSWTSAAESNVYKRGEVVNLQVSANTRPDEQLFIQSCFVSASPEPQTKPQHAVIMNKGCTAPMGSPHPVIQFMASSRRDVVNLVLNTSYLISELYLHCSVLISDQGVTSGSKSCNYNVIQSRWEDLSGDVEVCECCSSKCKGPSVRHFAEDAKTTVSTGPLVIVDKDIEMSSKPDVSEPQETTPAPVTDPMLSDAAVMEDTIISGASVSRSKSSSPPQGVVVVSQDPVARLTLWLPGQALDTDQSNGIRFRSEDCLKESDLVSNDLPVPQPSTTDQESHLNPPTNEIEGQHINEVKSDASLWDLNFLTLVDGWPILPQPDKAAVVEESPRRKRFGRSGVFEVPLPPQVTVNDLNQIDFNQVGGELAQMQADAAVMPQEGTDDVQPLIRSKLQFTKGMDGSQTLSYEEEAMNQQEGKGVIRRCGMDWVKRKQEPRQKGLRSAFLDFLRRMDKAE
ncbi:zona pellucida protein C [Toxotes jaculatrix]|uniref:zona pellucida protein C n=1 Tax=Toxotes jaculatrix TaxID=941984 RepID=UPI001B3AA7B6|nr:zona pellucida protein C [Toxotes jaculatrix]